MSPSRTLRVKAAAEARERRERTARARQVADLRRGVFRFLDREHRKRRIARAVRAFEIVGAAAVIALLGTAYLEGCR